MSDVLKGNFSTKRTVDASKNEENALEKRFEREALRHLGGSICYVAKQTVKWDLKGEEPDQNNDTVSTEPMHD